MRRDEILQEPEERLPLVIEEILAAAKKNGNKLDLDVQPDKYGDHLTAAVLLALWLEKRGISINRIRAADKPMFIALSDHLQKGIVPIGVPCRNNEYLVRKSTKERSVTDKMAELLDLPDYISDWVEQLNLNVLNPPHGTGIPKVIDASLFSYTEFGGNIWEAFNAQRFYMRGSITSQEFFFNEGLKVVRENAKNIVTKVFKVMGRDFKVNILYMETANPRAVSFALSRYNKVVKVDCVVTKNPNGHLTIIGKRFFDMSKVAEEIRKAHNGGKLKIILGESSKTETIDPQAIGYFYDVWFMVPDAGPRVLIGRFGHDEHEGTKIPLGKAVEIVVSNIGINEKKLPPKWLEKVQGSQVKPEDKTNDITATTTQEAAPATT